MQEQNFKNLSKIVVSFHLANFLPILVSLILSVALLISEGITLVSCFAVCVALSLALLFYHVRTFGLGNQDRIIRAEENFRCYRLTGKELDSRLSKSQIIALRFAVDSEYVALMDKAITQNLSAKEIKESIKEWRADYHRI
jgi:hypothetical protein